MVLVSPEEQQVYWASQEGSGDSLALHSAPLDVSPLLKEKLFGQKESVVLTSATLATAGGFAYLRQRLGLEEADELQVGSPFDYKQAALLMVPSDMPSPDSPHYQPAVQSLLLELALTLDGHTLALFTSHSALQSARRGIRDALHSRGIRVLAQGVDGNPRQLMEAFAQEPRAVLLGTSSFWEGVDLAGSLLRALVIARLPFDVPTEPVFAARSAQYEEPFRQYALPQAILRFRQGFGRLIRGKEDRGVVLVLDGRIISRGYGAMFLRSIPHCTMKKVSWNAVARLALEWVGRRSGG